MANPEMHDAHPRDAALTQVRDDPGSRKRFLQMAGAGAAGALGLFLAACGDDDEAGSATQPTTTTTAKKPAGGDIEIVNYALTLEYLEADFYAKVIASGVVKDKAVVELAKRIGENEQEHVTALTAAVKQLGGKPAAKLNTNFDAVLDGGPKMILATAATVENLGAAAYLGQAGAIENKDILAAALAIHSVEARHAAALNELAGRGFKGDGPLSGSLPDGAFAKPMTMDQVLAQAKPFIAA